MTDREYIERLERDLARALGRSVDQVRLERRYPEQTISDAHRTRALTHPPRLDKEPT